MLIGKRKEDNLYTGPGGGANLGESPKAAAIREVFEESNVKLKPRDLKELPTQLTPTGKLCHTYLAYIDRKDAKIHPGNDPDREVRNWIWHKINEPLPGKTSEARLNTFNQAKMRVFNLKKSELVEVLKKAIVSNPEAEIDINTAEEAQNELAAKDDGYWINAIESLVKEANYAEEPKMFMLPKKKSLTISKVDDGIYSAFVKDEDYNGGDFGEVLTQLSKMTVTSMVQALKAKGYIPRAEEVPEPVQAEIPKPDFDVNKLIELMTLLKQPEQQVHIHIDRPQAEQDLQNLTKGRAFPVGTQRNWGGQLYVKHFDGWVAVSGNHHGKLMGKFKADPTHKQVADQHKEAKPQDLEAKASALGTKAFNEGKGSVPATNPEIMKLLEGLEVGQGKAILEAYTKAWQKANLAAPVPEFKKEDKKPEIDMEKLRAERDANIAELKAKLDAKAKKEETFKLPDQEEIDQVIADNKSREASEAKARLTTKPEFVIEENGGYIKMGDGSRWEDTRFMLSTPEHMKAIAAPYMERAEATMQSYKMTQKQWLQKYKELERISGRLSKWQKSKAIRNHMSSISDAVKAGFITVDSKIPSEYPTLQENLGFKPEPVPLTKELSTPAQKKTNMIAGTHFKAVPKAIQEELNKSLNDANILIAEMGIKFKTPIYFTCTAALKSARDMGGHYSDSEKQIVIRNKNRFNKTLMHEIGHAIDYAMQDAKVIGRGVQRSQGRSAEAQTDSPMSPELKSKYKELNDLVTNSAFYDSKKEESGRWGSTYFNEPTEVFARAFEVYSRVKAEEAVKAGKISPTFLESFTPDLYKEENPDLKGAKKEYADLLDVAKAKEKAFRRLQRSSVSGEVSGKAMTEANEAYKKASQYHQEHLKGQSAYRDVAPEKRKEYENKITALMDAILKEDEIRKALALMDLNALLKSI